MLELSDACLIVSHVLGFAASLNSAGSDSRSRKDTKNEVLEVELSSQYGGKGSYPGSPRMGTSHSTASSTSASQSASGDSCDTISEISVIYNDKRYDSGELPPSYNTLSDSILGTTKSGDVINDDTDIGDITIHNRDTDSDNDTDTIRALSRRSSGSSTIKAIDPLDALITNKFVDGSESDFGDDVFKELDTKDLDVEVVERPPLDERDSGKGDSFRNEKQDLIPGKTTFCHLLIYK